ncbi:protein FAM177B [Zootoca vivipara]|uniref:protein FAM177B n=1 Tax=Zootoca vivipara TaxID=8524 RepID=UPI001591F4BB|nr:protein FAM177B isoform X2 [Zootoca vivipara]XP_060128966.1 protein FAM177B [Zootoca vivipara]
MEGSQGILKDEENSGKQPGDECSKGEKPPRRIIHFTSGETMEEYSTEEEDMEESDHNPLPDTVGLSWASYLQFWVLRIAATTFFTCEFLGGKFAALFGLNESKYQYAIDEYYRTQCKESESDEDGEEMQMEGTVSSNEKEHLERQSCGYGSIDSKETPAYSPENTVAMVNELEEGSLPRPKKNEL